MSLHLIIRAVECAALLAAGVWLLLYAERLQVRLNLYHENLKRTRRASGMFLRVTSQNYELFIRAVGGFLLLLFFILVVLTGVELERRG